MGAQENRKNYPSTRRFPESAGVCRRAFTFIEILMVVVIISISVGVSVPYFANSLKGNRMRMSLRTVLRMHRQARNTAILDNAKVRLEFSLDKSHLQIFASNPAPLDGGQKRLDEAPNLDASTSEKASLERTLEDGIRIVDVVTDLNDFGRSVIDWEDEGSLKGRTFTVVYAPDGSCRSYSVELNAEKDGSDPAFVNVDGISGRALIEKDRF